VGSPHVEAYTGYCRLRFAAWRRARDCRNQIKLFLKSPIKKGRRREGSSSNGSRRGSRKWRSGEEEEEWDKKEPEGDRRNFVASPPKDRKRLSGARPLVGRSPQCGGFRREGAQEQDAKGYRLGRHEDDGGSDREPNVSKRQSTGSGKGERSWDGEDGDNSGKGKRREVALAGEEKQQLDTDYDHDDASRAREYGRGRQESNEESVRIVAESFVDDVFDDLSASLSFSRMSLSLK